MILIKHRSAIWTHFRNIHDQDFQFKRDDVKAENLREFTKVSKLGATRYIGAN